MRKRNAPDTWVAPPKAERLATKKESTEPSQELSIDQQLNLATMDKFLPSIDFHGMRREDVRFDTDKLFSENQGGIVRIIYGHGTGAIAGEVLGYIRQLSRGKNPQVLGFREDTGTASCVVKIR